MLFQKVQQRYTRLINTIYVRCFITDQSWNTLQLKNIVLSFNPPFEPTTHLLSQSLPFSQLQVCDQNHDYASGWIVFTNPKTLAGVVQRKWIISL